MKIATKIAACASVLIGAAACAPDGYYDSRGNYHWAGAADDYSNSAYYGHGMSGSTYHGNNYYVDNSAARGDSSKVVGYDRARDPEVRPYRRAGYYDYHGEYVAYADGPVVARAYMPPRGKCRVWYPDLPAVEQPPIESCVGIQYRVPAGAYVIFGG